MLFLISYDIKNDKRRTRIHKALKSFGQWVQYSVFECDLEYQNYLLLRARLDRLITDEDSIRYYQLCESCSRKIERQGGIQPLDNTIIFVE